MQNANSHAVGTAVLLENDRIRVWDLVLRPGEASAIHRHTADYVFVCTTPGRITFLAEGQPPTTTEYDDGFVEYTAVGPGISHQIRNTGQQVYREILVELKGPSVAASVQPSEDNGLLGTSARKPPITSAPDRQGPPVMTSSGASAQRSRAAPLSPCQR